MGAAAMLIPFGIWEVARGTQEMGQLWWGFGESRETSDFIADGLQAWWSERQSLYAPVRRLPIELDNGPEIPSARTSS
jgi:hypothetical protein